MNNDILAGKWKQFRGAAKEKWGKLTDDELDQIDGRVDRLVGKVQERYGRDRKEAEREVKEFCERCGVAGA